MSWSLQHMEIDDSLAQMMHQSATFYLFLTQLRAMRALFRNPECYAAKLVNDSPKAIQFKNSKSIPALQQMLNKTCAKTAPTPGISCKEKVKKIGQFKKHKRQAHIHNFEGTRKSHCCDTVLNVSCHR